jgi:hydrogenase maturation factor HypE
MHGPSWWDVVAAIDGTHIRIRAPSADENVYVKRKNYHSINVMGVCDASMRLMSIHLKRDLSSSKLLSMIFLVFMCASLYLTSCGKVGFKTGVII